MRLYKRNAKGEPIFWSIEETANGDSIIVKYGAVASSNLHREILNKKLIKDDEMQSRIKAKRKEGYKEISELKDNAPLDITGGDIALINYLNTYLPKNNTTSDGFVLPMLAKVLKDNKPFTKRSYLGQYKINGVRCNIGAVKTNDMFRPIMLRYWSREGTEWTDKLTWMDEIILPEINEDLLDAMLDEGACLDGELYLPGYKVNDINSFVKNTALPQHYQLQFWCYDVSIENMSYEARLDFKNKGIRRLCYTFDTYAQHLNNKSQLVLLPDVVINNINDATRQRDKFISLGFEGLIIRDKAAEYQFGGRNLAMLKYKRVDDAKFKIVDIIPEGIRTNLCKFVLRNDINDETFEATGNFDHSRQEYILKHKEDYIGKLATCEYRERSGVKSVPFHCKLVDIKM
uniref:DNA ligase n=1 Tax=Geladintestivirus 4 TaxID=3233136 RepID=A0AAU8MJ24_9CAUD